MGNLFVLKLSSCLVGFSILKNNPPIVVTSKIKLSICLVSLRVGGMHKENKTVF